MLFDQIFFALWFFLPVGVANCTPIIAAKIPLLQQWSYPIDCYQTFRGKRILGDHKTIRGLLTGILAAIATVLIQQYFYNVTTINPIVFGAACAIGALGGDMIKSFLKRQLGIASGNRWFPFDQIDYIVGGIIATSFFVHLSFFTYTLITVVWFTLHIIFSKIGYFLKLKSVPY